MRQVLLPVLVAASLLPIVSQAQAPVALVAGSRSHQHAGTIRGVIRTNDGQPAAFVSVGIPKSGKGANTSEDGSYQITGVEPGSYVLQVSYVGLQPQQQTVVVTAGQTTKADFALTESSAQLSEVVVTGGTAIINRPASASKGGLAPLDLPQSVAVVSSTVIADQQINRLGDALKNVSGVSLTQQRQGVAETFSARGFSIGIGGGGGGSLFKNGLVANTQGFPDASTLESIEVLKGSSALLYGNVSGGVIINMATKKPRFNWGGEVEMRAGSYDFYKPIVDVYGPLSKNLAFRVVGTYENAKSFRDVVQSERVYVNPSLLYKFGDRTDLLLQGDYLKSNVTPDAGIGIINSGVDAVIPDNVPRSRFVNARWAYNHTTQVSSSVVLNHRFDEHWKLNAIAGLQDVQVGGFGVGVPNAIAADGTFTRTLSGVQTREQDYNAQLNLTGKFTTGFLGHQVLAGADAMRVVNESNTFVYTDPATGKALPVTSTGATNYDKINILDASKSAENTVMPLLSVLARTTSPSYRFGTYVQDLITLSPKFKVLGGVRWSYQVTQATSLFNQSTQVTTPGPDSKYDKAFSPKAALIYQPLTTLSVYGSYTNNFNINTGVDISGQQLRPSIVNQYEAGFKQELFEGRIFTNLTVYRYRNSNLAQVALYNADGSSNTSTNVKELTGETTSDGMDVDINGNFSQFYFNVGYGYNYNRYTNASLVKGSPIQGERLTNNPAHTGNASIFYTFAQPGVRGLKLGASAFYTGQRFGGNNNTYQQDAVGKEYNRLVTLTGFTTIDLTAGYTYHHLSLLLKLSNLTNTLNYLVHDRYSINPIAPRQFLTTVGYKF